MAEWTRGIGEDNLECSESLWNKEEEKVVKEIKKKLKSLPVVYGFHSLDNTYIAGELYTANNKTSKYINMYVVGWHPLCVCGLSYFKDFSIMSFLDIDNIHISKSKTQNPHNVLITKKNIPFTIQPLITKETVKIHNILWKWLVEADRSDLKKIVELQKYIPSECKNVTKVLYRGLQDLSPKALNKLSIDSPIELRNLEYSSWTYSLKTALFFKSKWRTKKNGIVIKYKPAKDDVLIDINQFEKIVFGSEKMITYGELQEVILKESPKMLKIYPDQVVVNKKKT
jgi:hypothetical protein